MGRRCSRCAADRGSTKPRIWGDCDRTFYFDSGGGVATTAVWDAHVHRHPPPAEHGDQPSGRAGDKEVILPDSGRPSFQRDRRTAASKVSDSPQLQGTGPLVQTGIRPGFEMRRFMGDFYAGRFFDAALPSSSPSSMAFVLCGGTRLLLGSRLPGVK